MKAILALIKTKLFIIIAAVTATAVTATIITVTVLNSPDSYRIVKVFEINGTATINRKSTGEIEAYVGMSLETGDKISVAPDSTLRLALDDDKYILLDASTEMVLEADGTAENSRTVITLSKGTILNEITQKLSTESSYEVNTPTSTMSVRGTIFSVTVTEDGDETYTDVSVLDGTVGGKITFPDGTSDGDEVLIPKGKAAKIKMDTKTTVWVFDDNDIDLKELPKSVLYALKDIIEGGKQTAVTIEDIMAVLFPKEDSAETGTTNAKTTTTVPPETPSSQPTEEATASETTVPAAVNAIVTTVPISAQETTPTTVVAETSAPKETTTPETTAPPKQTTTTTTAEENYSPWTGHQAETTVPTEPTTVTTVTTVTTDTAPPATVPTTSESTPAETINTNDGPLPYEIHINSSFSDNPDYKDSAEFDNLPQKLQNGAVIKGTLTVSYSVSESGRSITKTETYNFSHTLTTAECTQVPISLSIPLINSNGELIEVKIGPRAAC